MNSNVSSLTKDLKDISSEITMTQDDTHQTKAGVIFSDVFLSFVDLPVLESVTFTILPGETVALIGPSGCGKSTALHLIAGLLQPTLGTVLVNGTSSTRPRSTTALIPQNLGLLPWKTTFENAALGLKIRRKTHAEIQKRTTAALKRVGLQDFAHAYPKELSGGMQQRLALARALALDINLLLMDEPLSAIDALHRESLQDVLLNLWQRLGYTQIMVTHSIEEAVFLGQRIFVMSSRPGKLVATIENPSMGTEKFRGSHEFNECVRKVRATLAAHTQYAPSF